MTTTTTTKDWREYAESLRIHPVAAMFPMIEGKHYDDLCASIVSIGLIEPVVLMDDCLIDGRNRIKACLDLDIEPTYVQYRKLDCGEEPVAFYIEARNLARRDLTDDQRVSIAAKLEAEGYIKRANMKRSMAAVGNKNAAKSKSTNLRENSVAEIGKTVSKPHSESDQAVSADAESTAGRLAKKAGVGRNKATQALKAAVHAPEALDQVIAGKMPLAEAAKVAEKVNPPKKRSPRKAPIDAEVAIVDKLHADTPMYLEVARHLPAQGVRLRQWCESFIKHMNALEQKVKPAATATVEA